MSDTKQIQTQSADVVAVEPDVAQLFVDDALLVQTEEVWRSLHHPAKYEGNPVLEPDRPWEGYLVLQPGTVVYDEQEGIFKMWYNALPSRQKPDTHPCLCYAVSDDGIHWDKPELGLVEHSGSTANNIQLSGVLWTHCILKDDAEPDDQNRYKLVYWSSPANAPPGIYVAFSPDGIHWQPCEHNPVVPSGWATGDTFSVMRDPRSGQYWLYHKTPAEPIRTVSRLVSDDFIHWRDSSRVLAPDAFDPPDTQFYGLSAFPYAGQYLGFLWVYHTYFQTMDVQLVSSRDGLHWDRTADRKLWMHLVPTNHYAGASFDSMMIYPVSAPVAKDGQLWIYYSGFSVPHNALSEDHDGRIGLARLRHDWFCSLRATSEGYVLSSPFAVRGSRLTLNAAAHGPDPGQAPADPVWSHVLAGSKAGRGSVSVEVQDLSGAPIPGYSGAECQVFWTDSTEAQVRWRDRSDLSSLRDRSVQLKFLLRNASLYAWQIRSS